MIKGIWRFCFLIFILLWKSWLDDFMFLVIIVCISSCVSLLSLSSLVCVKVVYFDYLFWDLSLEFIKDFLSGIFIFMCFTITVADRRLDPRRDISRDLIFPHCVVLWTIPHFSCYALSREITPWHMAHSLTLAFSRASRTTAFVRSSSQNSTT